MRGEELMIPVGELLVLSNPSASCLHNFGAIRDENIPIFFRGMHDVVEVWLRYLRRSLGYGNNWMRERHDIVEEIGCGLMMLVEEDEPEVVFPVRAELVRDLVEFDELCSEMASCFRHDDRVKDFYLNLTSRVRSTFERLVGEGE